MPAELTLKQYNPTGDSLSQIFILNTKDSILYIDSLLPDQNYLFQVSSIQNPVSSNELNVTTMDTTSHNFTWQTFTFGEHQYNVLYDVAVIDENKIWAVGEIYMNDSLGNPDQTFYNAAHWDGNSWELKRILYQGGIWTIRTIYAFNQNDIWFSGYVRYYNGNFISLQIPQILIGWSINKLWGSSSQDLYAVGDNGNIAHYNGTTWQRIESGITLPINDVWGDKNSDGEYEVYCLASNGPSVPQGLALLRIKNNIVENLPITGLPLNLNSIWCLNDKKYFISGTKLFYSSKPEAGWQEEIYIYPFYKTSIKGQGYNNIFVVGASGLISHFDGLTWSNQTILDARFRSVDIKNSTFTAVGRESGTNKAVILLGQQ